MRRIFLVASIFTLVFAACEDSEKGCLDIFSNNFEFQAVSECDSCCTYPQLNINLSLVYGDTTFARDEPFVLSNNDTLIVSIFEILFSNFQFKSATQSYNIIDSFLVGEQAIRDDYIFIRNSGIQNIGSIRLEDNITELTFVPGFEESKFETYTPFSRFDDNSKLDTAIDSFYNQNNDSYYYMHIELAIEGEIRDLRIIQNGINSLLFPLDEDVEKGANWSLNMQLDLESLLNGINDQQSDDEMTATISNNLSQSVEIN